MDGEAIITTAFDIGLVAMCNFFHDPSGKFRETVNQFPAPFPHFVYGFSLRIVFKEFCCTTTAGLKLYYNPNCIYVSDFFGESLHFDL